MRLLTIATLVASSAFFGNLFSASAAGISASSTSGYDPTLAMDALFYSKAVTCDANTIANWTCASCGFNPSMKEVSVFTARDTQAYAAFDTATNRIVVAVRGSENVQNWIDDFTFDLVPYPHCESIRSTAVSSCKVHKGFYEVYEALSVDMVPAVQRLLARHPSASLLATGHSLGAAISILAALDLYITTGVKSVTVYNFGEPRVGDGNFTKFAATTLPQKSQFRVTHREDPVPHLPPIEFGFLHVPHEIFYNNNGNTSWVDCTDSYLAEDKSCSDQYFWPDVFEDHTLYLGVHTGCAVTEDALNVRAHVKLD